MKFRERELNQISYANKRCGLSPLLNGQHKMEAVTAYGVISILRPLFHVSVSGSRCVSGSLKCGRPIPHCSICQTYLPYLTLNIASLSHSIRTHLRTRFIRILIRTPRIAPTLLNLFHSFIRIHNADTHTDTETGKRGLMQIICARGRGGGRCACARVRGLCEFERTHIYFIFWRLNSN